MTTAAQLKAKLAKSLAPSRANPTAAPAPSVAHDIARKLSVSLHPTDLAKVESIRRHLANQGRYITVSEAIKLALRAATVGPELVKHLDELAEDDRRRK